MVVPPFLGRLEFKSSKPDIMFTKEEQIMWKRYSRFFETPCECGCTMLAINHFLNVLHCVPPCRSNCDVEYTCPRCGKKMKLHSGFSGAMLHSKIRGEYDRLTTSRGLVGLLKRNGLRRV